MPQVYNVGTRSVFINAAAWCVIAASAVLAAALVAYHVQLAQWLQSLGAGPLQRAAAWLMQHLVWALGGAMAFVALSFTGAVGLLKRLEWARRLFVGLTTLVLALLLAGLSVQHEVVALAIHQAVHGAELSAAALMLIDQLTSAARVLAYGLSIGAGVLLLTLIRALMSHEVRQEFA